MDENITWVTIKIDLGETKLLNVRVPFENLHVSIGLGGDFESNDEQFNSLLAKIQEVVDKRLFHRNTPA